MKTNTPLRTVLPFSNICFVLFIILVLLPLCACSKNLRLAPGKTINVKLLQATEYETVEIFGKILNTVQGVTQAKRYRSNIDPEDPEKCGVIWSLKLGKTDPFRLETNIMKMIGDILDAGGSIHMNGVEYRYTPAEVNLLKGIRPGNSTDGEICFIVDLDLSQEREMSGRHDPYNPR